MKRRAMLVLGIMAATFAVILVGFIVTSSVRTGSAATSAGRSYIDVSTLSDTADDASASLVTQPLASTLADGGATSAKTAQADAEPDVVSDDTGDYIAGQVLLSFDPTTTPEQAIAAINACDALDISTTDVASIDQATLQSGIVVASVAQGYTVDEAVAAASGVPGVEGAQRNNVYYVDDESVVSDASSETAQAASSETAQAASSETAQAASSETAQAASSETAQAASSTSSALDAGLQAEATVDDPGVSKQGYLNTINAPAAWDYASTIRSVTVAVIDTGCLVTHEDLAGVVRTDLAYDIVHDCTLGGAELGPSGSSTYDAYGHGTHVTGIIAAQADNGVGIAGVSRNNVSIVPMNVFSYNSTTGKYSASDASIIKAYNKLLGWVDDGTLTNLHVINLSLGGYSTTIDTALEAVIAKAASLGIVTVCSGGNYGNSSTYHDSATGMTQASYPSDFDECISVCWTGSNGLHNTQSDYNASKDIAAPGSSIYSTYNTANNAYYYLNGSSMAAPMVTGVVAMMYALDPSLTVDRVKSILYSTATDITGSANDYFDASATCSTGWDMYTGWGLVNAEAAVKAVVGTSVPLLSSATASVSGTVRNCTGSSLQPSVTLSIGSKQLVAGTDYVLYYVGSGSTSYALSSTVPSQAGTYSVTAVALNTSVCVGSLSLGTFTLYDASASVTANTGVMYHVRSSASTTADWILDAAAPMPQLGANISIWTDNGGANQAFTFELGSDGYYTIRNVANTSLVLDAAGAIPLVGSNVSTWTSNGGSNQKWVLVPTGTAGEFWVASAYDTGFVLDAAGSVPVLGANVSVWTNNGGSNQKWTFVDVSNLSNATTAMTGSTRNCTGSSVTPTVSVKVLGRTLIAGTDYTVLYNGSSTLPSADGSYTVSVKGMGSFHGEKTVGTFTLHDASSSVTANTGTMYHVRSSASTTADWILDAAAPMPQLGANISIWTDNGGANQAFTFELGSDGYYTIRNVANTSLVLDAAGAIPLVGSNVSTWTSNGGSNQKWVLVPTGTAGEFWVASAYDTGFVLDAAGNVPVLGANVSVWTNNGGSNQKWTFVAYSAAESTDSSATASGAAGSTAVAASGAASATASGAASSMAAAASGADGSASTAASGAAGSASTAVSGTIGSASATISETAVSATAAGSSSGTGEQPTAAVEPAAESAVTVSIDGEPAIGAASLQEALTSSGADPRNVTSIKVLSGSLRAADIAYVSQLEGHDDGSTTPYFASLASFVCTTGVAVSGTWVDGNGVLHGDEDGVLSDGAFSGLVALREVVLPMSVTLIGTGAFDGCTALQTLVLTSSLPPSMGGAILVGIPSETLAVLNIEVPLDASSSFAAAPWNASRVSEVDVTAFSE